MSLRHNNDTLSKDKMRSAIWSTSETVFNAGATFRAPVLASIFLTIGILFLFVAIFYSVGSLCHFFGLQTDPVPLDTIFDYPVPLDTISDFKYGIVLV